MNKVLKRKIIAVLILVTVISLCFVACKESKDPPITAEGDFYVERNGQLIKDESGNVTLEFNTVFTKEFFGNITEKYGEENVSLGTIIIPAEDVTSNSSITMNIAKEKGTATIIEAENNYTDLTAISAYGFKAGIIIAESDFAKEYAVTSFIKIKGDSAPSNAVSYDGDSYIYTEYEEEKHKVSVFSSAYNTVVTNCKEDKVAMSILNGKVTLSGKIARKVEIVPEYLDYTGYTLLKNKDGSVTVYTNYGIVEEVILNNKSYNYSFKSDNFDVNVYSTKGATLVNDGSAMLKGGKNELKERSYIAYYGNFGIGYYVDFYFTGKNLPEVMFFANDYRNNADGLVYDGENLASSIGSDSETEYKYVVGTKNVSGKLYIDAYLYKYDLQSKNYLSVKSEQAELSASVANFDEGDIVVYASKKEADTRFVYSEPHAFMPEYDYKVLNTYGYSSNAGANIKADEDVDLYQDYVDSGLNTYWLSGSGGFGYEDGNWKVPSETWQQYMAKGYYEEAANVADRVLFTDYYFYRMIEAYYDGRPDGGKLIGSSSVDLFSSQQALEKAVKDRLSTYYQAKNFYGLILRDEPTYKHFTSYGLVYRAIKKAAKELGMDYIYLHCNLFPMTAPNKADNLDPNYVDGGNVTETFKYYVNSFIDATGCDVLSVDEYPFRTTGFRVGYHSGLQILQEICQSRNVELVYVMQCFSSPGDDNPWRDPTLGDMHMQIYSSLGFGVKHLAFYTYAQGTANQTDSSCFINNNGEKNQTYYNVQEILEGVHKFSGTLLSYEYKGARIYSQTHSYDREYLCSGVAGYTAFDNTYEFEKIEKVKVDDDLALITEMYDKNNGKYMYMVQNILDSYFIDNSGEDGTVKVSLDFGDTTSVAVYDEGELKYYNINDGAFDIVLENGRAIFIIPLN